MKNILIPTDFSENSWNAIEYALHFFSKSLCNFYLLHVNVAGALTNAASSHVPKSEVPTSLDVVSKPAKKQLQDLVKRIHKNHPLNTNHRFFTITDTNYIISAIRKQVAEKRIDLIVMGTKGASGIKKLPIGSNTGNVITKVKCTTMVIPENAKYIKTKSVVFPTDFSIVYPIETLQPIADIVEANHAAVNILHVDSLGSKLNDDQQKNKEYLEDYLSSYDYNFHFLTNTHIEYALQKFVDSNDVNLIAMLAKNLNYFQKILFHPKVKETNYYKNVPFLVLH